MKTGDKAAEIHPTSVLGRDVVVADGVCIGPFVVVGDNVQIGPFTQIEANCFVGYETRIGSRCVLQSGCTVLENVVLGDNVTVASQAVIGSDGFGYVQDGGVHHKIPQVGGVVIEDDAFVGAGACVDRATTGVTRIGHKTVLGPLAHVGHNVQIGGRGNIGAQAGIAGSCVVGEDVTLGQGVGTNPHIHIGDRAWADHRAALTKDVPPDSRLAGYPALPEKQYHELADMVERLTDLPARVSVLEKIFKEQARS